MRQLKVAESEVHLWSASLSAPSLSPSDLVASLSSDEQARVERYAFDRDRRRSIASRGLLRWILSRYLACNPASVALTEGSHGKPMLVRPTLHFNVSHSDDLAVFAIARSYEPGVDIERVRRVPEALDIAARFFTQSEVEVLRSLDADTADEAFLVCWTRKEAYLKARGGGLSQNMNEFEVGVNRGAGAGAIRIEADPSEAARWRLYDLSPSPGFVGALAIRGPRARLRWVDARFAANQS